MLLNNQSVPQLTLLRLNASHIGGPLTTELLGGGLDEPLWLVR